MHGRVGKEGRGLSRMFGGGRIGAGWDRVGWVWAGGHLRLISRDSIITVIVMRTEVWIVIGFRGSCHGRIVTWACRSYGRPGGENKVGQCV